MKILMGLLLVGFVVTHAQAAEITIDLDQVENEEIRNILREAAAGEPAAQYQLACTYLKNPENYGGEKVFFWMHNAADVGYAPAQFMLSWMAHYGAGMDKNEESAREWLNVAAKNGDANAKKVLTGSAYDEVAPKGCPE